MSATLIPTVLLHDNPYQPRLADDPEHIERLARSIAADGLQQYPKARCAAGESYEIAFGHSRRKAFEWLAGNYVAQGLPDRYESYTAMPVEIEAMDDETMYRLAVTENVQRKDLDTIELAKAMLVYRDQFGKSSAEIGALYGVNDATVRGTIRFLDLHPAAQKLLAEGKISQGTARTLLSVQKIVDEKALKTIIDKIADAKDGNPEEIIESGIERNGNTIEMWGRWDSQRGGKPRAGHDLWLLDMKNFPNKLLEDLSVVEAAELIGIDKGKSDYEILKKWMIDYDQGAATTEEGWNALEFSGLHQEHIDRLRHLLNPPACNICPFYAVVDGSHYCGLKLCRNRKRVAFETQKLADMSRTLKIALYQKDVDGAYLLLDEDVAPHKKAFDDRHADLRLLPADQLKGYGYQFFKGVDNSTVKVVAVGESAEKLAVRPSMKTKGGKKTEKEKAEMRAMRVYRARRLELAWEYTATAQSIFEGVPLKVLEKLRGWRYVGVDDAIPDKYTHLNTGPDGHQAFARRSLVWGMIVGESSHYRRETLAKILAKFEAITGVKASKQLLASVEEWDAEIEQLATPVAAETPAKKAKK